MEIAQWRICDNLKNRSRTVEGRRGVLWFLVVLEFRLNPALTERAATGWGAESLSQDATAGRGPSRLRVNKPVEELLQPKKRSRTVEGRRRALWFLVVLEFASKPRPLGEGGYRVGCGEFESRRNSRAGQAPPLQGEWNGGWREKRNASLRYSKSPSGAGSLSPSRATQT